jgi:hypothetical protein
MLLDTCYERPDGNDQICKPLILKWLAAVSGYKDYPHSFKDQWIRWSVWRGDVSVSFDSRVKDQQELSDLLVPKFPGSAESRSPEKIPVDFFFISLGELFDIESPDIIGYKLIGKTAYETKDGDEFSTYKWEVFLDDETSIIYQNQKDVMDMEVGDKHYSSTIEQRAFITYVKNITNHGSN